ncbi:MAG: hypothetical protein JW757_04065 [Anaerolineales bacterium]|nr:hypothetical protein [Anaerolineales bacterium]
MSKKLLTALGLFVIFGMFLVACGGKEPPQNAPLEVPTSEPAQNNPDKEPTAEPLDEPEPAPRVGGWLDQVIISVVDAASAVSKIAAGEADVYGSTLSSPQDITSIKETGLSGFTSYGGNYEISFNTVGPTFEATGKLNPFYSLKVREAMQFLIDRDYIIEKVYAGAAIARYTSIATTSPEYGRYIEIIRPYEVYYQPDRAKAKALLEEGMTELGAELVDGKWFYEGELVELIFIIRLDGDGIRQQIGDIISTWLEQVGFTVNRQYMTASEASPIWPAGNMQDGKMHLYTGSWVAGGLSRDLSEAPQFYHSPSSPKGSYNMWAVYAEEMAVEDIQLLDDLANQNYTTMEQRKVMFEQAIKIGLKYNQRIFLMDTPAVSPYIPELEVAGNLATGIDINVLWPLTMRFTDRVGGVVRMIEPELFYDPANPVDGSGWVDDRLWQIPTQSSDLVDHPHTGLSLPFRLERAEVTVVSGLPVNKTLDWLTLDVVDEIVVPGDTWVDWDAVAQTWITSEEKFPEKQTAKTKVVYYYPENLFELVSWHDGSKLSVGDFMMKMIMNFDRSKEASVIYDHATVPAFEAFLDAFKGFKILSTQPLVIECYSDKWYTDAELIVGTHNAFWPEYGYGEAQWAMIAVGNKADAKLQLAYGPNKSDENEIEWMNFLGGPGLRYLEDNLEEAIAENFIPYEPTMGQYVTAEEAAVRYANIQTFYDQHNHFWIGTGPYILEDVDLEAETVTLNHNPNFPDLANRWDGFAVPKVGEVTISLDGRVVNGQKAAFNVYIEFQGEPYPSGEIAEVKYLLFNALNDVVEVGLAEYVSEGHYRVTLSPETTVKLEPGTNKLDVVGQYIPVALPSIETFEFVSE